MDITVNRTQKTFYQVDSTLAALLLEAFPNEFERIERPVPTPRVVEPQWGIGRTLSGFACIVLRLPNGEVRNYDGHPDDASSGFKHRQWSGEKQDYVFGGPEPPKAVVELYAQQYAARLR